MEALLFLEDLLLPHKDEVIKSNTEPVLVLVLDGGGGGFTLAFLLVFALLPFFMLELKTVFDLEASANKED